MTEGLLIKRRLRVVLVGVLIAVSSIMIKGTTGQSLELGCPLKVHLISSHFKQAQLIICHPPGYHRPVSME